MSGFEINVNLAGLSAYLDGMREKVEAAVRPAAQAGAEVLYRAVKVNVAGIGRKTGNLDSAIYQAFSEKQSRKGRAVYRVSWNLKKAPHGHLVEYGHIQRYKVYMGRDGNWYTAVRPEMRGKPKPKHNAPASVKDAYYIPLATPKQIAARSFIRKAWASHRDAAEQAMRASYLSSLGLE